MHDAWRQITWMLASHNQQCDQSILHAYGESTGWSSWLMSIDRTHVNNYIHLVVVVFVRHRCRLRRRKTGGRRGWGATARRPREWSGSPSTVCFVYFLTDAAGFLTVRMPILSLLFAISLSLLLALDYMGLSRTVVLVIDHISILHVVAETRFVWVIQLINY